ncbi:MAG: helix-hairpin-helix domain-containing protein [Nitrospira sp.]|nr:helix-hairpin-helix domain-containing protein [Nitrospira sp.]
MLKSLLVKLALLAGAVALIVWIGWPVDNGAGPDEDRQAFVEPTADGVPTAVPKSLAADAEKSSSGRLSEKGREAGRIAGPRKLDLNRATAQELQMLPGIGAVLAQRVVEWRGAHGPFRTVEELQAVKGIGPKRMTQLRPLLSVGASTPRKESSQGAAASRER